MFKSLTFGLSLALALGLSGVSKAGHFHPTATPQGPVVSPQAPMPSAQVADCGGHCGGLNLMEKCGGLFSGMGHKLNGFGSKCGDMFTGAGHNFVDLCSKLKPKPKVYTYEWVLKKKRVHGHSTLGHGDVVYPSSQVQPAPQSVAPAPQAYGSGQAYGSDQAYGSGQASATYGSGQLAPAAAPAAPLMGDEAPPAPEVAPSTPAPTLPPTTSLLFSTPASN